MSLDPTTHARFLSYRDRHAYFGRGEQREPLSADAFAALWAEHAKLSALGDAKRTSDEQTRLVELTQRLHLD